MDKKDEKYIQVIGRGRIITRKQYVKDGLKGVNEYVYINNEKLTPLRLISYERFFKYIESVYDEAKNNIKFGADVLKLMPSDGFLYSIIDRDLLLRGIFVEEITNDIIQLYKETIILTLLLLYKFEKI